MKKEIKTGLLILLIGLLLCGIVTVFAAERPVVYNSGTEGNKLSIIVGNLKDVQSVSCQVGNIKCEEAIVNDAVMLETYILIDNSLSIDSKYYDTIRQILLTLIETASEQEKMTLATFDRELHYLVQDCSDIEQLKQSVEGISYENLDTKVTDVMYSLCKELEGTPFDGLRRIVLISDGAEYSSVGYTRQEMMDELHKLSYPVYTIGCTYKDNTKELEEMFSISRVTGAESVWLDEETDVQKITDTINSCRNAIQVNVTIPDKLGDGTSKGVKLDFQTAEGEASVSATVVMPFIEIAEAGSTIANQHEEETSTAETSVEEIPTEVSGETQEETATEEPEGLQGETPMVEPEGTQGETPMVEPGGTQEETSAETQTVAGTLNTMKETEEQQSTGLTDIQTETKETEAAETTEMLQNGTQEGNLTDTEDVEEQSSKEQTETGTVQETLPVTPIAASLLIVLVVFLIIRLKKSGKKNKADNATDETDEMDEETTSYDDEPTMMDDEESVSFDDEQTMMSDDERTMMLDEEETDLSGDGQAMDFTSIRFTDMKNPARMFEVPLSTRVNVGRSVQRNQVVFDYEKSVSSQHCEIIRRGENIYIRDLNSTNGTWVNSVSVEDEMEIYSGAILKLGRLEVKFEII